MLNLSQLKNIPLRNLGLFRYSKAEIIKEVNRLESSQDRVLKFHEIVQYYKPFVMIDKNKSVAMLYSQGKLQKTVPVGVGKTKGDALNAVAYDFDKRVFGTTGMTTPSGQFSLKPIPNNCVNKSSYQNKNDVNVVLLDGVQHPVDYNINSSLGLHQIPNDELAERLPLFNSFGRRGMSTGCINFRTQDYEDVIRPLEIKTPVFILPEEPGNVLELMTTPNSNLWFRTKYVNSEQNHIFELAMNKFFNKG